MNTPLIPENSPLKANNVTRASLTPAQQAALPGHVGGRLTSLAQTHAARAESGDYQVLPGGALSPKAPFVGQPPVGPFAPVAASAPVSSRVARGPAIADSAVGGTVSGGQAINPKGGK